MKNYNEIAESILLRRDEYVKERQLKRKKRLIASSFVGCVILAVVAGVSFWQGSENNIPLPSVTQQSQESEINQTTANSEKETGKTKLPEDKPIASNEHTTPADGGDGLSGGDRSEWLNIPILPREKKIELVGDELSDEEAQSYFTENRNSIVNSLCASGVTADSIRISDKGYCHITYNGILGEGFEIRQNSRDYLVYNGDKLVAIITLYKENGVVSNTISFGAKWFDKYNNYLKQHKGEKLVYAYAGWFEIVVAPDNTYFNPMGYDVSPYLEGTDEPYKWFYHELNSYTP